MELNPATPMRVTEPRYRQRSLHRRGHGESSSFTNRGHLLHTHSPARSLALGTDIDRHITRHIRQHHGNKERRYAPRPPLSKFSVPVSNVSIPPIPVPISTPTR